MIYVTGSFSNEDIKVNEAKDIDIFTDYNTAILLFWKMNGGNELVDLEKSKYGKELHKASGSDYLEYSDLKIKVKYEGVIYDITVHKKKDSKKAKLFEAYYKTQRGKTLLKEHKKKKIKETGLNDLLLFLNEEKKSQFVIADDRLGYIEKLTHINENSRQKYKDKMAILEKRLGEKVCDKLKKDYEELIEEARYETNDELKKIFIGKNITEKSFTTEEVKVFDKKKANFEKENGKLIDCERIAKFIVGTGYNIQDQFKYLFLLHSRKKYRVYIDVNYHGIKDEILRKNQKKESN